MDHMRSVDRRRYWDPKSLGGGCVLHLPFYKYGREASRIWDESGNGNHGTITGATPAITPLTNGVELITNGSMEANSNWAIMNTGTAARSSTQKHAGSYSWKVTLDGSGQADGIKQTVSDLTNGKLYKVSAWFYGEDIQTTGYSFTIYIGDAGGGVINTVCTTGAWKYMEGLVTMDTGSPVINIYVQPTHADNAGKIFYIDDVSVQEVNSYESIGWEFDGVDDKVVMPDSANLRIADNLTILGWSRCNDTNNDQSNRTFIRKANGITKANFVSYIGSTSTWYGTTSITGWTTIGAAVSSPILRWNMVGFTFSGGVGIGYANGVAGTPSVYTGETLYVAADSGTLDVGSSFASPYYGQVGDVIVFNRALSPQEIKAYYENTRKIYGV